MRLAISFLTASCLLGCSRDAQADPQPPDITGLWRAPAPDVRSSDWCLAVCENGRAVWGSDEVCTTGDSTSFVMYRFDGSTFTAVYADGSEWPFGFAPSGDTAEVASDYGERFTVTRSDVEPAICDKPDASLLESPHD